jgi:hypothetical protein
MLSGESSQAETSLSELHASYLAQAGHDDSYRQCHHAPRESAQSLL